MERLPTNRIAWMLVLIGAFSLGFSVAMQAGMWLVELGLRPESAGAAEYIVGFISGLPSLLVALIFLALSCATPLLRSQLALVLLIFALLLTLAVSVLLLRDFIF